MSRDLRLVLQWLGRYKKEYLLGIVTLAAVDVAQVNVPQIIRNFTNDLQAGNMSAHLLWHYIWLILGIAAFMALGRFLWRLWVFGSGRNLEVDVRETLFAHWQKLSASYYHRSKIGDLMAHATNDVNALRTAGSEGVLMAVDATTMTLLTVGIMIHMVGWQLALIVMAPLPVLAICTNLISRVVHKRFKAVQKQFGTLSDKAQENLAGMRVVKVFVQEEAEKVLFGKENDDYVHKFMGLMRYQGALEPVIGLLLGSAYVLVLAAVAPAVVRGSLALGDFVAVTLYLGQLVWPMLALGWVINIAQRSTASMNRIQAILDEVPEVADAPGALAPAAWQGRIDVKNLTFRYRPDLPPALENISLSVKPGQTLGIIGRTGSGKTTLANLLVRLFNPPVGSLLVDGIDVNQLPLQGLRANVGYVPQDSFLFSKSIEENIAFDPQPYTHEQVTRAAEVAQVHTDISEFPRGYTTLLGERGITLSGGQRQRTGIARAVLKNPPILILDDCLSAVDTATEARILEQLQPIMDGRTTVVISHRVSSLMHADEIIVLDQGRIVERGRHRELLALGGEYAHLYQMQQLEAAIAAEA